MTTRQLSFTNCSVYERPEPEDGFRVLVSRYWPRGITKDRQDLWLPGLGPSRELIREFKAGHLDWDKFRERYMEEFARDDKARYLDELLEKATESGKSKIILMCVCKDITHCHSTIVRGMLTR